MCMSVLPATVSGTKCIRCLRRPDEGIAALGTGSIDSCEHHVGAGKSKLGPLEEQVSQYF